MFLFTLLLAGSVTAAHGLDWKVRSGNDHYLRGAVTVPAQTFTHEAAKEVALKILEESRGVSFLHAEIFADEDFPPYHYMRIFHVGYEWWQRCFSERSRFQVGRLVGLNGNIVLNYRSESGNTSSTVLSGSDPLMIGTPKGTFKLLHFGFWPASPLSVKGHESDELEVFAQTDVQLGPDVAKEIYRKLKSMLPLKEIMLYVRNDSWFLDVPGYPLEYSFGESERPPTRAVFAESTTLDCGTTLTGEENCHRRYGP